MGGGGGSTNVTISVLILYINDLTDRTSVSTLGIFIPFLGILQETTVCLFKRSYYLNKMLDVFSILSLLHV